MKFIKICINNHLKVSKNENYIANNNLNIKNNNLHIAK